MAATAAVKKVVALLEAAPDQLLSRRELRQALGGRSPANALSEGRRQLAERLGPRLEIPSTSQYKVTADWTPPPGFAEQHPVPMEIYGTIAGSTMLGGTIVPSTASTGINHAKILMEMDPDGRKGLDAVGESGNLLHANLVEVHINTLRRAGAPIDTVPCVAIRSRPPGEST